MAPPVSVRLQSSRCSSLCGAVRVPGDKSISHRAVLLAALASGTSRIEGLLEGRDVLGTIAAVRALGAVVEPAGDDGWSVEGVGVGNLSTPLQALDFGNSGTGVRLVTGALATTPLQVAMHGDESLSRRPMNRVLEPLMQMGLQVLQTRNGSLPMALRGASYPVPITYALPVPSAQVKSAVLLAALNTPGRTTVIEAHPTRDHTERMLRAMRAAIETVAADNGRAISIDGPCTLRAQSITVPGDPSSAAFVVAAALLVPASEIVVEGVLINPTRTGFYTTLVEMGGDVAFENERDVNGETVADIRVRSSALTGVSVPAERAPSMIDEYPILAVLAAFAEGATHMAGIGELRVKESDRIAAMEKGLKACGVAVGAGPDWLRVTGARQVAGGATVQTDMDHRIAMSFLVLGLASQAPVRVDDADMIATSFPGFVDLMRRLGALIEDLSEAPEATA